MADFNKAFELTLGHEGGYSNDVQDPGGETYKGVARKKHPKWAGWVIVDSLKQQLGFPKTIDTNSSMQGHVKNFYKASFWDEFMLDKIDNQDIANELFDSSVNLGTGREILFLQQALNILNRNQVDYPDVKENANMSSQIVLLVNTHKRPLNLLKTLNGFQFMHYYNISKQNSTFEKYFNGWINRVW